MRPVAVLYCSGTVPLEKVSLLAFGRPSMGSYGCLATVNTAPGGNNFPYTNDLVSGRHVPFSHR